MALLTKRDITIAVFKAAASQVPGYGPFVAEAVGAIDQRAAFDALDARISRLESILIADKNSRISSHKNTEVARRHVHITLDIQEFSKNYQSAKQDPIALEKFLVNLNEAPTPEYFNARPGVRICMLEEILSNKTPLIVTGTTITLSPQFIAGSDQQAYTVRGREALISAAVQELGKITDDEDCFILLSSESEDKEKIHFTYVPEVWRLLGFQFILNREFHEGIGCFIRAVELGVYQTHETMVDIATTFMNAGHVDYGIKRLKLLVESHKYDLHGRIRLADALDSLGKTAEAEIHYQAFINEYESRLREIEGYAYGASSQINYERARIALGLEV